MISRLALIGQNGGKSAPLMDSTHITRPRGDYLWGSFFLQGRDGETPTWDPATGALLGSVAHREAAVDSAVEDARAAGDGWRRTDLRRRIGPMLQVRDLLQSRRGALAMMASAEMGKPLWEAGLECAAAVRAIDLLVEAARLQLVDIAHPSARGTMCRIPVGVVGVMTPYPYPIYSPIQTLIPCLLGGNAVVWNPSSEVPLTSQRVVELFDGANLPPGVLSMVQGPRSPIGHRLVTHPGLDLVAAAGSAEMGDAVRIDAVCDRPAWAQTGGKGWAIVCGDADLDRAAYEIVTSAFLTSGQRCNATARALVERPYAEELLRRVVSLTRGVRIGSPKETGTFCGPLANNRLKRDFKTVLKRFERVGLKFVVEGGEARLPAELKKKGTAYVSPAVVFTEDALPARAPLPEEVQGPLLIISTFDGVEDAAERYNTHPYGLAASVFTESEARFRHVRSLLRAGAVNWNRGTIVASARYSNTGLGRSGQGAEANAGLLYASTWPQSTLAAAGPFDPSYRVPGMEWPDEMKTEDSSSLHTPPYRPEDEETSLVPNPRTLIKS